MDTKRIIEQYINWIKDNTLIKSIEDDISCEVITPFMDRHNDHIQIYIIKRGNEYILTDDGYTISDLRMSGMEINTPKREKIFSTVRNGFGVKLGEDNELFIESNLSDIGQKKHYLLQAILAVNDMNVLSQEMVYSLFKEDVERYFRSNEIFFSKDVKITGKTGFHHNIDFLISASKTKPERLIRTINIPKKDTVMATIFSLTDISTVREQEIKNYLIYNDLEKLVAPDIISALSNYDIDNIPWIQKHRCLEEFALN